MVRAVTPAQACSIGTWVVAANLSSVMGRSVASAPGSGATDRSTSWCGSRPAEVQGPCSVGAHRSWLEVEAVLLHRLGGERRVDFRAQRPPGAGGRDPGS